MTDTKKAKIFVLAKKYLENQSIFFLISKKRRSSKKKIAKKGKPLPIGVQRKPLSASAEGASSVDEWMDGLWFFTHFDFPYFQVW